MMYGLLNIELLREDLDYCQDYEMQSRLWLNIDNPAQEMSSFVEMACGTFDDTNLSDVIEMGKLEELVGSDATKHLLALDTAVDQVDGSWPEEQILESQEMVVVRHHAKLALEALKEFLQSQQ